MESWDDDNFEPKVLPTRSNKWEGEDEEEDVKESWEDEEEEGEKTDEKTEEVSSTAVQKPKKKTLAEKIAEKEKARLLELEKKMKEQEEEDEMTPEEKIRRQKESDLNIALETTFGGSNCSGLDAACPNTLEEFEEFGEAFLKKVRPLATSNTLDFLVFAENLIRNLCAPLTSNDLKKIKTTIDNLVLEKQKIEKGDKAKKNKGKGKAKLKMDNDNQYSAYVADYDEYDDFM